MNLKHYYYYFQSALPRLCDDIIKYGTDHKVEIGLSQVVLKETMEQVEKLMVV